MPGKNKAKKLTNIIAIDGPAGSGKSTVAKALAKRLGFLYVDTGAMYRALTLKAMQEKINFSDEQALVKLAKRVKIHLQIKQDALGVMLDGKDVTRAIREQAVTEKVCFVAQLKDVRRQMVKLQRRLAQEAKGAVLEGRDIGTVVFPQARYKFYLDAQEAERIRRRYKELRQMGELVSEQEVSADIQSRDQSDMTRDIAPLAKAEDAFYIDTTNLSINAVVEKIIARCSM